MQRGVKPQERETVSGDGGSDRLWETKTYSSSSSAPQLLHPALKTMCIIKDMIQHIAMKSICEQLCGVHTISTAHPNPIWSTSALLHAYSFVQGHWAAQASFHQAYTSRDTVVELTLADCLPGIPRFRQMATQNSRCPQPEVL